MNRRHPGGTRERQAAGPARRAPGDARPHAVAPSRSTLPPLLRRVLKRGFGLSSRVAWPLARLAARPGYDHPSPPVDPPGSIALIACHWIGDTLWAAQVVPALRSAWPEAEITVLTKARALDVWSGFVAADGLLAAPEITSDRHRERTDLPGLLRRAAALRGRRFDLVVDLTGTRYSALFAFLLRPRWSLGLAGDELDWLYSCRDAGAVETGHARERPFRLVARVIPYLTVPAKVIPPRPSRRYAEACVEAGLDPEQPLAVLAPGAGWPEKRWPEMIFVEVASGLASAGIQVAIVGAAGERELCARIQAAAGAARAAPVRKAMRAVPAAAADERPPVGLRDGGIGGRVEVVTGLPLGTMCGLLSGAAAVIGHDSGIAHLAAAYDRPVLALLATGADPAYCAPIGGAVATVHPGEPRAVPEEIVRWTLRTAQR